MTVVALLFGLLLGAGIGVLIRDAASERQGWHRGWNARGRQCEMDGHCSPMDAVIDAVALPDTPADLMRLWEEQ